jgi:membrane-bound lytic murein transglycosylase MltF
MRLLTSIIAADLVVGLAVFPAGAAFEQVAQAPLASTPPAASSPPPASTPAPSSQPRQLGTTNKVWKGDFDRMLQRRMIRVLVPYSRTLFFNDKGQERGVTAELVRRWEQYINKKYAAQLGKRPVTIYMVATTRDKLIPQVAEGLGDIAAGNITVTEARLETVDFAAPEDIRPVNEIVVAGPKAPPIKTTDDLSGATVHVRRASSYYESLQALNERFAKEGKPPVKLVLLPDALEDDDAMEMANAGVLDVLIVDDWKATTWAPVLPQLKVTPGAAVRSGAHTGWVLRKDSPKLAAELTDFYTNVVKKQGVHAVLRAQAAKRVKEFKNNTADEELKRFQEMLVLFRKYGQQYNFDPLMLAAQGYQESGLNQNAKSHVGAIGVMQIMPTTGAQLKVGDITVTESNIHAGAKYMDQLMTKYFQDAKFSETNRALFAFASYNCGPGNVSKMRKLAVQRNLDPDKWFNNVEVVTSEKIGGETTTYVRNIYKYYVAYKLTLEHAELQQKLKEQMRKGG